MAFQWQKRMRFSSLIVNDREDEIWLANLREDEILLANGIEDEIPLANDRVDEDSSVPYWTY